MFNMRRNAHGGIVPGQPRIMQQHQPLPPASSPALTSLSPSSAARISEPNSAGVVASFAEIPNLLRNTPNYQLFHNMLVYNNDEIQTVQENLAAEKAAFDSHQQLHSQGYSCGMQTAYAPHSKVCCVGRSIINVESIYAYIDRVSLGVLHAWKDGGSVMDMSSCFDSMKSAEKVCSFTPADRVQCIDVCRKLCSTFNITLKETYALLNWCEDPSMMLTMDGSCHRGGGIWTGVADELIPALKMEMLLSCDANALIDWYMRVLDWISEQYICFPTTDGLKWVRGGGHGSNITPILLARTCAEETSHFRSFKDSMVQLLVKKRERLVQCMQSITAMRSGYEAEMRAAASERGQQEGNLALTRKATADTYNNILCGACNIVVMLHVDTVNRAIHFYRPAVLAHGVQYIRECVLKLQSDQQKALLPALPQEDESKAQSKKDVEHVLTFSCDGYQKLMNVIPCDHQSNGSSSAASSSASSIHRATNSQRESKMLAESSSLLISHAPILWTHGLFNMLWSCNDRNKQYLCSKVAPLDR